MTGYIEREAFLDAIERGKKYQQDADDIAEMLQNFPTADVRPVVLCKDCYAYRRDKELAEAAYLDPQMYCGLLRCEMGEDSFCSYGKRKEET